jgi:hypothetical protein
VYEVQFQDGHTEEYAVNEIAAAIYAQVNDEGFEHLILDEIIDYRKTVAVAVPNEERYVISPSVPRKVGNCVSYEKTNQQAGYH